jgi:protein-tyrosine phosphatase
MVPARDDGVQSIGEGLALLRETARRGTAVQFATPHVNRRIPLTTRRATDMREAHATMAVEAAGFGLDLQLGFELSPEPWLLDADPLELRLGRLSAALLEFPLPHTHAPDLSLLVACAEHLDDAGLTPVLAHPERSHLVHGRPEVVREFRERGWLLQVNASSLLADERHPDHRTGWWLLERDLGDLVASDAHRATRPPYLDAAYAVVEARLGERPARRLLCGSALEPAGLAPAPAAG